MDRFTAADRGACRQSAAEIIQLVAACAEAHAAPQRCRRELRSHSQGSMLWPAGPPLPRPTPVAGPSLPELPRLQPRRRSLQQPASREPQPQRRSLQQPAGGESQAQRWLPQQHQAGQGRPQERPQPWADRQPAPMERKAMAPLTGAPPGWQQQQQRLRSHSAAHASPLLSAYHSADSMEMDCLASGELGAGGGRLHVDANDASSRFISMTL